MKLISIGLFIINPKYIQFIQIDEENKGISIHFQYGFVELSNNDALTFLNKFNHELSPEIKLFKAELERNRFANY